MGWTSCASSCAWRWASRCACTRARCSRAATPSSVASRRRTRSTTFSPRRGKVVDRILRRDATLDGVAPRLQRARVHAQRLANRPAQLLALDVHPVYELAHRVLDLQPGVHLQEVELPAWREQEFDRARAEVAHGARGGGGRLAHTAAQRRRHRHGGRLLDELLVTSLDAALALPQRDHAAEGIRQDLDLDVARPLEVLLAIDFIRPERLARLARSRFESRLELGFLSHQPHALATRSLARLEEYRIPEPGRLRASLHMVGERSRGARHNGNARLLHAAPRFGFVAHGPNGRRRG